MSRTNTGFPTAWTTGTNFIEIDVRDGFFRRFLAELGWNQYLGVSADRTLVGRLRSETSGGDNQFVHSQNRRVVRDNNADVLILSGRSVVRLWSYRSVRHAPFVAWRLDFHPLTLLAMLGWLIRVVARQYEPPMRLKCRLETGATRLYLISRVTRPKHTSHDARHFIPQILGLRGLFSRLNRDGAQYAVLRWFEDLPNVEPEGDIDLLIEDDRLSSLMALLRSGPGIRPCDVYTPSGLARSRYLKLSYYPPELARRILARARLHSQFCRVPCEEDHFLSLAYHAVYHKGPRTNLPGAERYEPRSRRSERDFRAILEEQANRLGIDAEISLEGLHQHLTSQNWSPAPDLLVRLAAAAPRNTWLADLAKRVHGDQSVDPGLTVFVIRDSAVEAGVGDPIIAMIEHYGFDILAKKVLTPDEVRHGAPRTRGGNWGPGPRDHLGGQPAIVVVAFDPHPIRPSRGQLKRFPLVTNARTLVKEEMRRRVNDRIKPRAPINGVHSSDNGAEAHHFLSIFAPELVEPIRAQIALRRGRAVSRAAAA